MPRKQYVGIKFPITKVSEENTFFDLTSDPIEAIKSELMHLIFTPKGQRLRNPDFGTRLIEFIFQPNDQETWGDIEMEIREAVSKYIPGCTIEKVQIYESEEGRGIVVEINFTVSHPQYNNTYQILTSL